MENPSVNSPQFTYELKAEKSGYIAEFNTVKTGLSIIALGGGRKVQSDIPDPSAGFILQKKHGDEVQSGDLIASVFC